MQINKLYLGILGVLSIIIIWLGIKLQITNESNLDAITDLKKSIIESDKLQKEANGQYSKLVDYYSTQSQMLDDLKNSNIQLYNTINKNGEKILSLSSTVLSLKDLISSGSGKIDSIDSSKINFKLTYPDKNSPFITWDGGINRHTAQYLGKWYFGKLPIKVTVTEDSRGLWKHRISGPEWLVVDSLTVKSLPPSEYNNSTESLINLIGGPSIGHDLTTSNNFIGIGIGLNLNKHNIILNMFTNNQVNLGYYYTFKTIKKK
jgi:hypothetical protein